MRLYEEVSAPKQTTILSYFTQNTNIDEGDHSCLENYVENQNNSQIIYMDVLRPELNVVEEAVIEFIEETASEEADILVYRIFSIVFLCVGSFFCISK